MVHLFSISTFSLKRISSILFAVFIFFPALLFASSSGSTHSHSKSINGTTGGYESVQFQVNMKYALLKWLWKSHDGIALKTDYYGWNVTFPLSDPDHDSIYTTTITLPQYATVHYRFWINPPGDSAGDESIGNQTITPIVNNTLASPHYFNNDSTYVFGTYTQFVDSVVAFSSEYSSTWWSANQVIGAPDFYPGYGDDGRAWASADPDDGYEFLQVHFAYPAPIYEVHIYETYKPGAVQRILALNPNTSLWDTVWTGTPGYISSTGSRILRATFPTTAYNVSQIRVEFNTAVVSDWNEIDAISVLSIGVTRMFAVNMKYQIRRGLWSPNRDVGVAASFSDWAETPNLSDPDHDSIYTGIVSLPTNATVHFNFWKDPPGGYAGIENLPPRQTSTLPILSGQQITAFGNDFEDGSNPVVRFADSVAAFSSQYSSADWSANQVLGPPDTYPNYIDTGTAWSSYNGDDTVPQWLDLLYPDHKPIYEVNIYETYAPGSVESLYVKNPTTNLWVLEWSRQPQAALGDTARILKLTFPRTTFDVNEIRVVFNVGAIPNYQEIDAISIIGPSTYSTTMAYSIDSKWNLMSVPLIVPDFRKSTLFPTASSSAFAFQGGYIAMDTMQPGRGYWLRFDSTQSISVPGTFLPLDTFIVSQGWDLVGSISTPVPVNAITSIPGGIVTSQFFGYNNGYSFADTIKPGQGYWVKTSIAGQLIFSLSDTTVGKNSIKIVPTTEKPPAPPVLNDKAEKPYTFALDQNYPNPFNPSTVIRYQLPKDAWVTLELYNTLGEKVMTLLDGMENAGYKSITVNATNLPSGIYFYRLHAGTFMQVKKMLLMK